MTAPVHPAPTTPPGAGRASVGRVAAVRHAQRAAGQAAALASMIAGGRPFGEVALQVLAVRGSIDSLLMRLLELELDACLPATEQRGEIGELVAAALGRRSPVRSAGLDVPGSHPSDRPEGRGRRVRAKGPQQSHV